MLTTIDKYRDIINELFKSKASFNITAKQKRKLKSLELSNDQWDLIKMLIELLKPFYSATKVLSTNKYPTVGSALFIIKNVQEHLEKTENSEMVNILKMKIFEQFKYYLIDYTDQFNTLKVRNKMTCFFSVESSTFVALWILGSNRICCTYKS